MQATIKRKPLPTASPKVDRATEPPPYELIHPSQSFVTPGSVKVEEEPLPKPQTPVDNAQQDYADDLENQLEHLQLEPGSEPLDAVPDEVPQENVEPEGKSKWKHAFDEVKHFAGGLIAHPYEATKHYSVLRHSHGIVFYQGPYTSVAISIFSDQDLPADRQVWMQRRGFSGKTGLKIGTLGTRSAWINVTPAVLADASSLPPNDERAWQRDTQKFLKNTATVKSICDHTPRETHVLRVPHLAEDGYFRVVLCAGRKVLCPSPTFRLVSTSTDPGRMRGASLSTLPLEVGVKIGALVAKSAAQTASHGAMQPAITAYQNVVQPYEPGQITRTAVSTAYNASLQPKVDQTIQEINQDYLNRKQAELVVAGGQDADAHLLGPEDGPQHPFPIEFIGKVVRGSGATTKALGRPSANLEGVSQEVELRLSGVYAAWVKTSSEKNEKWHAAIVGVHPRKDVKVGVVERRSIRVMILAEVGNLVGTKMSVMLVAFLHTSAFEANPDVGQRQLQLATDISIVDASLARPQWTAEAILSQLKQQRADRSMIDKAADARRYGQKQTDKVPIHRAGIRTNSMSLRDQVIGNGGIYVLR